MKIQLSSLLLWVAIALGAPTVAAAQSRSSSAGGDFLSLFQSVTRGMGRAAGPAAVPPADGTRPLIVRIAADRCSKCGAGDAAWHKVEKEFAADARVVELDVTDEHAAEEAEEFSDELGIADFFDTYRARPGSVAFFRAGSERPVRVLDAEADLAAYREAFAEIASGRA